MAAVNTVLTAAWDHAVRSEWKHFRDGLDARRQAIDAALASSDLRAYGFTTRLGHRDNEPAAPEEKLLDEHLVGATTRAPDTYSRLAMACLAQQVLVSPSGAPTALVDRLFRVLTSEEPLDFEGAWAASYGAGDVVPAAWLFHNLIGSADFLPPGSTISAINGRHMSTATGLVAFGWLTEVFSRALSVISGQVRSKGGVLPSPLVATTSEWPERPQLPLSLRDMTPLISTSAKALSSLLEAIEFRLSGASGNPLFSEEGNTIRAVSQNSFLDLTMTMALHESAVALSAIASCLHRVHVHLGASVPDHLVQTPKVMKARLDALEQVAPRVIQFGCSESDGVEDLRDLGMISALAVCRMCRCVDDMLTIRGCAPSDPGDLKALQALLLPDDESCDKDYLLSKSAEFVTTGRWLAQLL